MVRGAAADDPAAFVGTGECPSAIDEIWLGGDALVREIKLAADEDARPGGFILSGSSRFLDISTLPESLAGRIAFIELWPLSMAERTGWAADPLDCLFGDPEALLGEDSEWDRREYLELFPAGVFRRRSGSARNWSARPGSKATSRP